MTSPRPNKVTYGCYPSIPHALRFTKGSKGLMPHPVVPALMHGGDGVSRTVSLGLYLTTLPRLLSVSVERQ